MSNPSGQPGPLQYATPVPWREVNNPPTGNAEFVAEYAKAVQMAEAWAGKRTRICVTSSHLSSVIEAVYTQLLSDTGGAVKILPGIKPHGLIHTTADWAGLAEAAQLACDITGSTDCVIEGESACGPFITGAQTLNRDALKAGLELLPQSIRYLWYPAMQGESDGNRVRSFMLLHVVWTTLKRMGWIPFKQSIKILETYGQNILNLRLQEALTTPSDWRPIIYAYLPEALPPDQQRPNDWAPSDLPYLCTALKQYAEFLWYADIGSILQAATAWSNFLAAQ